MQIAQQVVVVTGGASGIGRALCLAFAQQDAAAVVVADIDADGAAAVAETIKAGGRQAAAATADVADPAAAENLIAQAEDAFGPVGLVCSNAGIIVAGGVELPDEAWSRIWAINVQSHVSLARAVLPRMLARGGGYLVFTASAAGLLTQLGSAPYAVTKHAVVALAEWLSITYGDQGIRVSCLCPQAVHTNLLATSRVLAAPASGTGMASTEVASPEVASAAATAAGVAAAGAAGTGAAGTGAVDAEGAGSAGHQAAAVDGTLTPDQVAACVIEGLADERFLILPHPEVAMYERRRAEDRERWLRGMRRLQARLTQRA